MKGTIPMMRVYRADGSGVWVPAPSGAGLGAAPAGQTKAGTISQDAEKVAGVALKIAPELPPPADGIVAGVASVVVTAARIVDAIWGTSKDKANLRKAGQINQLNSVLRQQIQEIDVQNKAVSNGLTQLSAALKTAGLGGLFQMRGLGDLATNILNDATASNAALEAAVQQKTQALQTLIETFNDAVTATAQAVSGQSITQKIVLWTLLGAGVGGVVYVLYKNSKKKKSNE